MQVDVGKVIDDAKLNRLHYLILGVGLFVLIVDAYDLVSMGIVIPRLAEEWGIDPKALRERMRPYTDHYGVVLED